MNEAVRAVVGILLFGVAGVLAIDSGVSLPSYFISSALLIIGTSVLVRR